MRPDEQKQKYKRRAGYGPNGPKTKAAAAKDEQIKANNSKSQPPQVAEGAPKLSDEKRGKKTSNKNDGSKGKASSSKGKTAFAKDVKSKNQSGSSVKVPEEVSGQKEREKNTAVVTNEESGSDCEADPERPCGGGQFRRRKVESNWDRYKEDSEDEYDEEVIARKAAEAEELAECRGVVSEKLVSGDQMTLEEEEDERGWLVVDDVTDDEDDVSEFDFVEHGSPTSPCGDPRPKPSSTICVKISADPAADKEMADLTDSLMKTLDTDTRRKPTEMVESLGEFEFDASEEVTLDWDNVDAPQPQRVLKGGEPRTRPEAKEPEVKKSVEDDELDSLLALSAPVRGPKLYSDKVKGKSKPPTATSADPPPPAQDDESLESWLDSMI